jgi:hypothetical protein
MSDLSSCYFCGTALDAPLDRHTLAASGDDPTTVVLCPTCRRKLVSVLERVLVAAPDAEGDTLVATAAAGVDGPDEEPPAVADVTPDQGVGAPVDVTEATESDGPESADAATTDADSTANVPASDAETAEDPTGRATDPNGSGGAPAESSRRTAAAGDAEPIFDESQTAAGDDDDEAVFGEGADAATATTAAGDVGGVGDEGAGEAAASDDDAGDDDVVREAEPTRDGGDADADSTAETAAADDGRSQRVGDTGADRSSGTPDTETYNRVIRLLQNREFPVVTGEIEEVAVNAYGMEPTDFRAVVDAAVERGVIDERGDRLVRPD